MARRVHTFDVSLEPEMEELLHQRALREGTTLEELVQKIVAEAAAEESREQFWRHIDGSKSGVR